MGLADLTPGAAALHIEVAYSPAPRQVEVMRLDLPAGSSVADALRASGLLERHALVIEDLRCGVWGRVQAPDGVLRDGDRVEVYRPLLADPKEMRRRRARLKPSP